jgi:SagB-type dehydrogenase family enzyme
MKLRQIKTRYNQKDQSLYGSKKIHELLSMLYHENTKLDSFTSREQGENIAFFKDDFFTLRSIQPFKSYPSKQSVDLSPYTLPEHEDDFMKLLGRRRSVRKYDPAYKVSLNELSKMLNYSYGITHQEKIAGKNASVGYRNIPSPGAVYPLEIYVALFNSHLEQGLYHFSVKHNSLEMLRAGNHLEELRKIVNAEPFVDIKSSCGVIFITGMIERVSIKYGERGYRFMQQEVGSLSYIISLIAQHIGLSSCNVGSCLDDKVNEYLEIDGLYESIYGMMVFGRDIQ